MFDSVACRLKSLQFCDAGERRWKPRLFKNRSFETDPWDEFREKRQSCGDCETLRAFGDSEGILQNRDNLLTTHA